MAFWLSSTDVSERTVALVGNVSTSFLSSWTNIPWALMDRSPPADPGLLGRLQWRS